MAVSNSLQTMNNENRTLSVYLQGDKVQKMLVSSLGSERAKQKFVSSLVAAASANPALQKCDFATVISSGLLATSLNLSLSPSLGLAYIVPFEDRKNKRIVATFILGYRGYIQLAIRSGFYADIDVIEIRQGEYLGRDNATGKHKFRFVADDDEREKLPVVGYMAMFEYLNGFKKVLYWSKEKMLNHADTYSKAFSVGAKNGRRAFADFEAGKVPEEELWKYSSYWYKDFDSMAKKTLIRQLISKWGIMSIDMQTAYDTDTKAMENEEDAGMVERDDAMNDFFGNTDGIVVEEQEITEVMPEEENKPKRSSRTKQIDKINVDLFGDTEIATEKE